MITHIEIYQRKKLWYWRMKRKGRVVADGSESYKRRPTLLKTLKGIVSGGFKLLE